jgi:4-diphosphocytidyl-2-C-methyl-D-erythritol kinase
MENDLEAVTVAEHPVIDRIKRWLLEVGAIGALMSGSGPTVFGVFRQRNQAVEAADLATQKWRECWVAVTMVRESTSFSLDSER